MKLGALGGEVIVTGIGCIVYKYKYPKISSLVYSVIID